MRSTIKEYYVLIVSVCGLFSTYVSLDIRLQELQRFFNTFSSRGERVCMKFKNVICMFYVRRVGNSSMIIIYSERQVTEENLQKNYIQSR